MRAIHPRWLLIMAAGLGLAGAPTPAAPPACPGFVLASGTFDGAQHEIDDQGFFAIGGAGVSFKPQTPAWYRANELRGQDLELVLRPIRCRPDLERLER
jgi:hypothetical protein